MPDDTRRGNQTPTYHYCAPYTLTEGRFATQLSTVYSLTPHPWQASILDDWLAVDPAGRLVNSYCLLEVPRQNGKTGACDPRETWGLIQRAEQILHTAQEYQTAKKAFDRLRVKFGRQKNDPFAVYPELNALVDHYTTSAGQMVLDLKNGGHIEFRTRGSSSDMGRGGTFDLVVIDEAQSYTDEQDAALSPLNSAAPSGSPQTILMGTPPGLGSAKGEVFRRLRDAMHKDPHPGQCIHEWSVDDIGDPADRDRWYLTNPSLGYQLLVSAIEKDSITMAPDMFAMEHLGYWSKPRETVGEPAIDKDKWEACKSYEKKPEGKTAYGVKFSADGTWVCLAGAVLPEDGRARISVIQMRPTADGLEWLAEWLRARYGIVSAVCIDGRNGVDVLIDKISQTWAAKGSVIRPGPRDVIAAASYLLDAINSGSMTWYGEQTILNESALTAIKRPISGGFGFGGEKCLPIEACSLALFAAHTSKRDPRRRMRLLI